MLLWSLRVCFRECGGLGGEGVQVLGEERVCGDMGNMSAKEA